MKKIILVIIIHLYFYSNAQQCVTVTDDNDSRNDAACDFNLPNSAKYCINVKFHILRDNNQTNGFDPAQLPSLTNLLNYYFNPHGITIINVGYDFYNSTDYNNVTDVNEYNVVTNTIVSNNAFDFYLVKSLHVNGLGSVGGRRCMVKNSVALSTTSAHELGHCLDLQHTFYSGSCAENASNCQLCGDFICDTVGDTSPYNIMSYNPNTTMFTSGQGLRMRNSIRCKHTARRSNMCTSIIGATSICTGTYTYTLSDAVPGASPSWAVSSNLQILSFNSTSITVQAISATTNGSATITVNLPGASPITKNIFIGKPSFTTIKTQINMQNIVRINMVGAGGSNINDQGITNVVWETITNNPANCGEVWGTNFLGYQDYYGNCGTQFRITATNSCGTTVYTSTSHGIAAPAHRMSDTVSYYRVYPNPASDVISISVQDEHNVLKHSRTVAALYDLNGLKRMDIDIKDNYVEIDVSQLIKGIYIIRIDIDGQSENHQIIVE